MGCANSTQSNDVRHYKKTSTPSPVRRSFRVSAGRRSSFKFSPGRPSQKGGAVTTLGWSFMREDETNAASTAGGQTQTQQQREEDKEDMKLVVYKTMVEDKRKVKKDDQFALGLIEAKTWSSLMDERVAKIVPKTPIRTPPGEPETINLWEMMEGLEDTSPLIRHHSNVRHGKSFSIDDRRRALSPVDGHELSFRESAWGMPEAGSLAENESNHSVNESDNKRPRLEMDPEEMDLIPEFDPDIISMFRKSLEELSQDNLVSCPKTSVTMEEEDDDRWSASVTKKTSEETYEFPSGKKDRVVLYFTSLQGIRKTYEDCRHVRDILKGLGVRVDEKDLSMHSRFKEEVTELLGEKYKGGELPRVFIGKKYIGGAEEIRRLHEDGQLEKLVETFEKFNNSSDVCEACSDTRFIPCQTCSGSCKLLDEFAEDDEEMADDGFGFHRCPDCNENGLVRCPLCFN